MFKGVVLTDSTKLPCSLFLHFAFSDVVSSNVQQPDRSWSPMVRPATTPAQTLKMINRTLLSADSSYIHSAASGS